MYPQYVCSQQASPINVSPHEQDEKTSVQSYNHYVLSQLTTSAEQLG